MGIAVRAHLTDFGQLLPLTGHPPPWSATPRSAAVASFKLCTAPVITPAIAQKRPLESRCGGRSTCRGRLLTRSLAVGGACVDLIAVVSREHSGLAMLVDEAGQ